MQIKNTIPFSKWRYFAYGFSILLIILAFAGTALRGGFNFGIEFKAGLSQQIKVNSPEASVEHVRAALDKTTYHFSVQPIGNPADNQFVIKASVQGGDDTNHQQLVSNAAKEKLDEAFGTGVVVVQSTDYTSPGLSNELIIQTFTYTIAAVLLILVYIWFRFKFAFAMAAIIALIHDPIFLIGLIGTFQIEVNTVTIAALLTIIGYSLNDTIVVFDRIRENIRLKRNANLFDIVDAAITQTLSRTIVSSITVLLSTVAIYIFTKGPIHDFAAIMMVGVIVGTYSSIFVAAPLMVAIAGGKAPEEKEKEKPKAETAE